MTASSLQLFIIGEWFHIMVGTRQGDPISPTAFMAYLERVMTAVEEKEMAVSVNGLRVNNLRFADDIDLLETNRDTLQENLELLKGDAEKMGLKINIGKTKTMVFGKESLANKVETDGMQIDNVNEFVYLGSLLTWFGQVCIKS